MLDDHILVDFHGRQVRRNGRIGLEELLVGGDPIVGQCLLCI